MRGRWVGGDDPQQENRKVSRSTENLDNFTLKWKYPTPEKSVSRDQPNSLVVLQDYRMNRFASGGSGGSKPQKGERSSPSSGGGGGIFSKNKKRQQAQQVHSHPQKTFQISLVSKQPNGDNKVTNLSYNDLGSNNGGSNGGGGGSGGGSSPSLLERVTDLPSGLY